MQSGDSQLQVEAAETARQLVADDTAAAIALGNGYVGVLLNLLGSSTSSVRAAAVAHC
jgi:hypothetical protein